MKPSFQLVQSFAAYPSLRIHEDMSRNGSPIDLLVQPAIIAYNNKQSATDNEYRVWLKAIVWMKDSTGPKSQGRPQTGLPKAAQRQNGSAKGKRAVSKKTKGRCMIDDEDSETRHASEAHGLMVGAQSRSSSHQRQAICSRNNDTPLATSLPNHGKASSSGASAETGLGKEKSIKTQSTTMQPNSKAEDHVVSAANSDDRGGKAKRPHEECFLDQAKPSKMRKVNSNKSDQEQSDVEREPEGNPGRLNSR